jgi:hypothetical protein
MYGVVCDLATAQRSPGFCTQGNPCGVYDRQRALGQVSLRFHQVSPVSIIPPLLNIHTRTLWVTDGPVSGRRDIFTPTGNNDKILQNIQTFCVREISF